jgi:RNA polymerase sporulation-specific sigma factor
MLYRLKPTGIPGGVLQLSGILTMLGVIIKEAMFFVSYVKNHAFPQPLSKDEEAKYISQMQEGDPQARNKLIEHNLRLVAHIVKKFENTGEDPEDLISIGTIGLIKGVESFKAGKGTKLATYAARCIENEILMHLRALKKVKKDVSLHDPIGQDKEGNEISLIDILEAENEDIIEYIQLNMEIEKMGDYLSVLDAREKEVIIYRYGLNNSNEMTQREIAKQLNISRSYVSRIEKRALMKVFREYYREERET